jgi:hypothetical protein
MQLFEAQQTITMISGILSDGPYSDSIVSTFGITVPIESNILPVHKKGDKTECSSCRGISLLSTSYKILSNILLSKLIPYIDEIIGDH